MKNKEELNFKEYVDEVLKTESNDFEAISKRTSIKRNVRLLHSTMGVSTELSEIFEALLKKDFDLINLREEVGDCFWYIGLAVDEMKLERDEFYNNSIKGSEVSFLERVLKRIALKDKTILANIHACTCLDLMKKEVFYGKKALDEEKMVQELQAVMRNLISILNLVGQSAHKTMFINIDKLQKKRYSKGKFTSEEAINRDLEAERESLSK